MPDVEQPSLEEEQMNPNDHPPGMDDLPAFPLIQALLGRRSRRFALSATIPDGPLAFTSGLEPLSGRFISGVHLLSFCA
jgi:hypothetical protein